MIWVINKYESAIIDELASINAYIINNLPIQHESFNIFIELLEKHLFTENDIDSILGKRIDRLKMVLAPPHLPFSDDEDYYERCLKKMKNYHPMNFIEGASFISNQRIEGSKEQVIAKLTDWCKSQNIPEEEIMNVGRKKTDGWIKDAGDQVHFRTPINGNNNNGFVQTDFMFSKNVNFQRGSMIGGSGQYRGEHRHIVLSSIARARGIKYSPKFGLVDPETDEPLPNGDDWNIIAKQLLGQSATVADVKSVDAIINYIKKLPNYEELISAARETLGRYDIELPKKEAVESYQPG